MCFTTDFFIIIYMYLCFYSGTNSAQFFSQTDIGFSPKTNITQMDAFPTQQIQLRPIHLWPLSNYTLIISVIIPLR